MALILRYPKNIETTCACKDTVCGESSICKEGVCTYLPPVSILEAKVANGELNIVVDYVF